jgi:hypothetical protein
MTRRWTRRQLLTGAGRLGASLVAFQAARKGLDLLDQHFTWDEASQPNSVFLARNAERLKTFELGGSFAPEQWYNVRDGANAWPLGLDAALNELNIRQMRLGIRWSRVHRQGSDPDLRAYRRLLDRCLSAGIDICLNPGAIKTFRWPEEHVPDSVLKSLDKVPGTKVAITPDMPLAQAAYEHLDRLMDTLRREYSAKDLAPVRMVQVENEPFYALGKHQWLMSPAYLHGVADRLHAAFPDAEVLVTTAGRLNIDDVRDLLLRLREADASYDGKLVSGFDFHYRTPTRDSYPVIRYFDQISYARPLIPGTNDNIADSRLLGYRIEVTEGQMEPYDYFQQPGNSVRDLRYMLQRCFDHVLDPERPGLVRLWGVEELVKKMVKGDLTDDHRQIIELIQTINDRGTEAVRPA